MALAGRTAESRGLLYHNYLENHFQAMEKPRKYSKCRVRLEHRKRHGSKSGIWAKVHQREEQKSRRDRVIGLQGTYLSD